MFVFVGLGAGLACGSSEVFRLGLGLWVSVSNIILASWDWLILPNVLLFLSANLTHRACAAKTIRNAMFLFVSMAFHALLAHQARMHRLLAEVALEHCIALPLIRLHAGYSVARTVYVCY